MSTFLKTAALARRLGVGYWRVYALVHRGVLSPSKDSSGDLLWSEEDTAAAAELLGIDANRRGPAKEGTAHPHRERERGAEVRLRRHGVRGVSNHK